MSRPLRSDDEPALRRLTAACRQHTSRHAVPQPHDLTWLLALDDVARHARVWERGSEVVALALPQPARRTVLFDVHPGHRDDQLTRAVQAEVMTLFRAGGADEVATPLESDDPWRRDVLGHWGFVDSGEGVVHLSVRGLEAPLHEGAEALARWPGEPLGDDDLAAYVSAHRAAFGTDTLDLAERRAWLAEDGYDPRLDLVVRDGGAVVGFSVGYLRDDDGAWSVEIGTVGVVPQARGRGVGHALVLGAMDAAHGLGVDRVWTSTATDNQAMRAVATRAGMTEHRRTVWWSRHL